MLIVIGRTILFFTIFGMCTTPVFSQRFQRVIGNSQDEVAEWIAPTADRGSIICGFEGGASRRPYVVKLDQDGNTIWDSIQFVNSTEVPTRILELSGPCVSGAQFALSGETSVFGPDFGISLVLLGPTGNYVGGSAFEGTAFVGGGRNTGLDEWNDGTDSGFVLCGRKLNVDQVTQEAVLINTDCNAFPIWQKHYRNIGAGANAFMEFEDVHQTWPSKPGFIVTGSTSDSPTADQNIVLMKTAPTGEVEWCKSYGFPNLSEAGFNCAQTADGYIVTGFTETSDTFFSGTFLLRTDCDGNLVSYTRYRSFDGGQSMYETPSGNIIISGNVKLADIGFQPDAALLNVDPAGNVNWCRAYGGFGLNEFDASAAVALMPDGGFQLAGITDSFSGSRDIYTVRTNGGGFSTCNEREHTVLVSQQMPPEQTIICEATDVQGFKKHFVKEKLVLLPNEVLCQQLCSPPPAGMVAWYPLDDAAASPLSDELAFNNRGVPFGAVPGGGVVNESACFDGIDDYYEAPNAAQINFGTNDFTVDAWVLTLPSSGIHIILDKRTSQGGVIKGYSVYTDNGRLAIQLADGGFTNYVNTTGPRVDDDMWHHVAITVDRDGVGTFYVDCEPVGTFSPTNRQLSISNDSVLRIGARSFQNSGNWNGCIDEVELFKRVLSPDEIFAVCNHNGKCRDTCHTDWDAPFCANASTTTTTSTICNNGTGPATYMLELNGLSAAVCGDIDGPTSFKVTSSGPVNLDPGECMTVQIEIDRPAGMNAANLVACFEAVWTNQTTGITTRCVGSVQDRRDYCAVFIDDLSPVSLVPGEPLTLPVTISAGIGVADSLDIQIVAMRADRNADGASIVSLDGLPPGESVTRTIKIPPDGEETVIEVDVELTDHEPFVFYDIILMIADEDGVFQASDALGIRSLPPSNEVCDNPLGDINGDGEVNLLDVDPFISVISTGEYLCEADCNEDGAVDLLDIDPFIFFLSGG